MQKAVLFGLFPAFVLLAVWSLISFFRLRRISPTNRAGWRITTTLFLAAVLSVAVATAICNLRVHITEAGVNKTVQMLGQIKLRTGTYPSTLPKRSPGIFDWLSYPVQGGVSRDGFQFMYLNDPWGDINILESDGRGWQHLS